MKNYFRIYSPIEIARQLLLFSGFLLLGCFSTVSFAQADTARPPTADTTAAPAEEAAEEESTLISPTLEFIGVQKSDNTIDLRAKLRAKVKGWPVNLHKMKVTFIQVVNEEDRVLGFVITNGNGKATLNIKADTLKPDAEGKLHFKAIFAGNKAMDAAEEVADFKRARLEMTPVKEDSLLTVEVRLVDISTEMETPVKETLIGVFVKRLFLPLKVGEGTTDENGDASVEFPLNLPGDAKGNMDLLARLDEHETYGYLEASVVIPWGIPVSNIIQEQPRALWSSHPPLWMLITFIVLMVAVWGHYIVIIYELFRLRKEQPHSTTDATNL